jgi:uncharacterized protein YegP (UPF0339 family)
MQLDFIGECAKRNVGYWSFKYIMSVVRDSKQEQESIMPRAKQRAKVIFEFFTGRGKHKFHWRARSSNGQIIGHSEGMLHKASPKKTVANMIEAIKLGQYRVEDNYE